MKPADARILTPSAERSVRLLMSTLAQHRRQEALLALNPALPLGRVSIGATRGNSGEVRRQATLLRLMSIVEAFTAESLVTRLESDVPPPRSAIVEDVYTTAEDNAIASWPNMKKHFGQWFGIKLSHSTCPSLRRVEAMTNARNAVAHGLGDLTRRMARKDLGQLKLDFATIDISIAGNSVQISEQALRSSATAAREFVEWLDGQLAAAP